MVESYIVKIVKMNQFPKEILLYIEDFCEKSVLYKISKHLFKSTYAHRKCIMNDINFLFKKNYVRTYFYRTLHCLSQISIQFSCDEMNEIYLVDATVKKELKKMSGVGVDLDNYPNKDKIIRFREFYYSFKYQRRFGVLRQRAQDRLRLNRLRLNKKKFMAFLKKEHGV